MQQSWVYRSEMTYNESMLLQYVMKKHRDSFYYIPIAVAKREEIGIKYRFLCIAHSKLNKSPSHFTIIGLYKPEKGMPYATSMGKITFDNFNL